MLLNDCGVMRTLKCFNFSNLFNHGKSSFEEFLYMHLPCVATKYFFLLLQSLILYISATLVSNYGIMSSYVDCTGSFLSCYEVEKRNDNSRKFLDLDGDMLIPVGSAEITLASHLLHKMHERTKFSPCN